MRAAIIGTGFLGRAVVANFENRGVRSSHTYNTQQYFPDSVHFDLFSQNLTDAMPLGEIDTVIFTSMIENSPETESVLGAMRRAFLQCKDKRVIYISSDAVFDGQKGNYVETDTAVPVTAYGKHKKFCEDLLREIISNYCIIRPSYIYGFSIGKLDNRLDKVRMLVQSGQSIKKFVEMFKSPTEVNQLAEIIKTVSESDFRGILHACGKRLSVYDFFDQALKALGERTDLLEVDHIPENPSSDYLIDTSLDSAFLKKLFCFEAVSMEIALGDSNCPSSDT